MISKKRLGFALYARWVVGIAFACCGLQISSADILEYSTPGTGTLTQGSIVHLNVTSPGGIMINQIQHQARGDSVQRDFHLYYRAGTFDELIDGQPAHQVASAWSQISLVENVSNAVNELRDFTLNLNQGAGGTLALAPGLYTFFFHSVGIAGGNANGIRVVTLAGTTGTTLVSDANAEIIGQVSKAGAAFGGSNPTIDRVPGHVRIDYTVIPEPSGAFLLLSSLIGVVGLRRRS